MAFRFMRLGWALAGIVATMAITSPSYATGDRTFSTFDEGWNNVIVIGYDRMIDVAPLALINEQPPAVTQRSYQTYAPIPVKTHRFGAAILATTQAGWGSGRLRKLAG
jgi:hypothetical protein